MPFRSLSDPGRVVLLAQIEGVEKVVQSRQGYLTTLREESTKGVWFSDIAYSKLPPPKPDCYVCLNRIPQGRCSIGGNYGVVCTEYLHFTRGVEQ